MDFNKAQELLEKNKHLIGQKLRGIGIDELILIPTDEKFSNSFLEIYLHTLNYKKSIIQYIGLDVDIYAMCKEYYQLTGIAFYTNILNLEEEFSVIKD